MKEIVAVLKGLFGFIIFVVALFVAYMKSQRETHIAFAIDQFAKTQMEQRRAEEALKLAAIAARLLGRWDVEWFTSPGSAKGVFEFSRDGTLTFSGTRTLGESTPAFSGRATYSVAAVHTDTSWGWTFL